MSAIINNRSRAAMAALVLAFSVLLTALPAFAGESTLISGFDRYALGSDLPPDGDEFWSVFSGPIYETVGGMDLIEYETTYNMQMATMEREAKVTLGYAPDNLLEVIIVDLGVLGEPLDMESAEALSYEIIGALQEEYHEDLQVIDAFPGGPDRMEDAAPDGGSFIMADELGNSIWLTWNGTTLQTMYAAAAISGLLIEQAFGAEALEEYQDYMSEEDFVLEGDDY